MKLREAINRIDIESDIQYDLLNTYDVSNFSNEKKVELCEMIKNNCSAKQLYEQMIDEYFEKEIDLDRVAMDVGNLLDSDVLGDDWIEVFPTGGQTPYELRMDITGSDDVARKAVMIPKGQQIRFYFKNGSEQICSSQEEIARFIYGVVYPDKDYDSVKESLTEDSSYVSGNRYYGGLPAEPSATEYGQAMSQAHKNFMKFLADNNIYIEEDVRLPGMAGYYTEYSGDIDGKEFVAYETTGSITNHIIKIFIDNRELDLWNTKRRGLKIGGLYDLVSLLKDDKDWNIVFKDDQRSAVTEGIISGKEKLSYDELADLEKKLYSYLKQEGIYPEDGTFRNSSDSICDLELYLVIDGDWKHDHQYSIDLVNDFCEQNNMIVVNWNRKEIGESDSDWYKAEYNYYICFDQNNQRDQINSFQRMFATESLDEEKNLKESNGMTFYGIPGTEVIWHGEWSDPELLVDGVNFNYSAVENYLWQLYIKDCEENNVEPDDGEGFASWVRWNDDSFWDYVNNVDPEIEESEDDSMEEGIGDLLKQSGRIQQKFAKRAQSKAADVLSKTKVGGVVTQAKDAIKYQTSPQGRKERLTQKLNKAEKDVQVDDLLSGHDKLYNVGETEVEVDGKKKTTNLYYDADDQTAFTVDQKIPMKYTKYMSQRQYDSAHVNNRDKVPNFKEPIELSAIYGEKAGDADDSDWDGSLGDEDYTEMGESLNTHGCSLKELCESMSIKPTLVEEYDEQNFTTIDDILSDMIGNMSDQQLDSELRIFQKIRKALGLKQISNLVVYLDREDQYQPDWYFTYSDNITNNQKVYIVNGVTMVYEVVNGNSFLYFKSMEDAETYFQAPEFEQNY